MTKRLKFSAVVRALGLGLWLACASGSALAAEYIPPNWADLLQTMIRFKALDITDNTLLDQYAMVSACDLYTLYYADDFKWNQVRGIIRDSLRLNAATLPTSFGFETPVELERYDFDQKSFLFTESTVVRNINAFKLFEYHNPPCRNQDPLDLPKIYRAVLDTPVTITGIPITQKDGEAMLARMRATGNESRRIYARFNLTIVYIESWQRRIETQNAIGVPHYSQSSHNDPRTVRMNARLDSISFFEDGEMTRLIYETKL